MGVANMQCISFGVHLATGSSQRGEYLDSFA
jgi:hypothetical protein